MSHTSLLRLSAVLGTVLATAAATTVPAGPAGATAAKKKPSWTMVASGLDNPRQLSFDARGHLFVAEAGRGGSGPCQTGPEGDQICFGTSGAVSRIGPHARKRVLTGLPSLAAPDGSQAIGPADVLVDRKGRYLLSVGLGADPAVRTGLPKVGKRLMGTLVTGKLHRKPRWVVADLARYEAAKDPDGNGPDSNPVGFARAGRTLVATDAGANDLLRIGRHGRISTIAVFADRTVPNPFGGPDVDLQPVPTSVVRGPDGAWYVSQLTGFPFPAGGASIFRVVPGRAPQVYATGLTNVTDLAWHRGKLYAVQLADAGLLGVPEGELPQGSLVRVPARSKAPVPVASGLPAPYGVAIRHGSAYVTTCSVCPGGGGVARVPLH